MVKCNECLNEKCDTNNLYHAGQFISDDEYKLAKHRKEAFVTCQETCWCWDLEAKLFENDKRR